MQDIPLHLIAFFAAFLVAYYNTSNLQRFRNLFFLIYLSGNVLFYSFCYGLIGLGVFAALDNTVLQLTSNQTTINSEYLYAFIVGVSTKAFADINLLNIQSGSSAVPIGVKTITAELDKYFEKRIESSCFFRYTGFLEPYKTKYNGINVSQEKGRIAGLLREYPNREKVVSFLASEEFAAASDSSEVMGLVLKEFGEKTFRRLFP